MSAVMTMGRMTSKHNCGAPKQKNGGKKGGGSKVRPYYIIAVFGDEKSRVFPGSAFSSSFIGIFPWFLHQQRC